MPSDYSNDLKCVLRRLIPLSALQAHKHDKRGQIKHFTEKREILFVDEPDRTVFSEN